MIKRVALYLLTILLAIACSTTRYVPEGDKLYTGIKKVEFTDAKELCDACGGELGGSEVLLRKNY